MARGINKVILVGNLGSDPEVRYTQDGAAIANLSIATSESWKDRNTGEQQTKTEWHRCVCYRRTAEIAQQYLRKGSKIYVEGKLQTRKWQDQNGQDRYTTEIVINDLQMLDAMGQQSGDYSAPAQNNSGFGGNNMNGGFGGNNMNSGGGNFGGQPQNNFNQNQSFGGSQQASQPASQSTQTPAFNNDVAADFDDDIPF